MMTDLFGEVGKQGVLSRPLDGCVFLETVPLTCPALGRTSGRYGSRFQKYY